MKLYESLYSCVSCGKSKSKTEEMLCDDCKKEAQKAMPADNKE